MRKISFICFFSFINVVAYSQVTFGVKSGINIATVKDINAHPDNRLGWYGGAAAYFPLHKKFFFVPELLYSSKGYSDIGNLYETQKTVVKLNYLTAPLQFGYRIDHKTSLLFGPEIGYLLSAYQKSPYNTLNVSYNFPVKVDVELDIGLRYKIIERTEIEIRYTYGFKNMYTRDITGVRVGDALAGNRVFQIGCLFSLRK